MSFMGVGSFAGAMFIATMSKSGPKKFILYGVPLILGVLLIITGFTNLFFLTGLCLAVNGFFFVAFSSSANTTMQLNATDEFRGRVMSIYTLVFAGTTPLGNLYAGSITERFNARIGFIACGGIIILLLLLLYAFKSRSSLSSNH